MFKKKTTPHRAAATLIHLVSMKVLDNWDQDKHELNSLLDDAARIKDEDDAFVQYELILAIIALETLSVENLSSKQSDTIKACILSVLNEVSGLGDYIYQTLNIDYPKVIEYAINTSHPLPEPVITLLAQRLEINVNFIRGITLSNIVFSKVGSWKYIIDNFKIK